MGAWLALAAQQQEEVLPVWLLLLVPLTTARQLPLPGVSTPKSPAVCHLVAAAFSASEMLTETDQ